jgi:hypothetical protein
MKQLNNILMRIVATFAASGLGVIGAGAIAGVSIWKACFMAGMAGVATVVVFNKVDKKAKAAE